MCMVQRKVVSKDGEAYILQNIRALQQLRYLDEIRAYLKEWAEAVQSSAPETFKDANEEAA